MLDAARVDSEGGGTKLTQAGSYTVTLTVYDTTGLVSVFMFVWTVT